MSLSCRYVELRDQEETSCGHQLHAHCVLAWAQWTAEPATCPACTTRRDVAAESRRPDGPRVGGPAGTGAWNDLETMARAVTRKQWSVDSAVELLRRSFDQAVPREVERLAPGVRGR